MKVVAEDGRVFDLAGQVPFAVRGEAQVFLVDVFVLKIYKRPEDPGVAGNAQRVESAKRRLREGPEKLARFPLGMPHGVVAPWTLLYNQDGTFAGFLMEYVQGTVLQELLEEKNTDMDFLLRGFRSLRRLLVAIHAAGAVVADLAPTNILVTPQGVAQLIDADSMQYDKFASAAFTPNYIDPRRYGKLDGPHKRASTLSDWYGFNVLLFQALFRIRPYDGVLMRDGKVVPHTERIRRRLTVLHREVTVPTTAEPFHRVPAPLMDYFVRVLEHDLREEFPVELLQAWDWATCTTCQLVHARANCPGCATARERERLARTERTVTSISRPRHAARNSRLSFETSGSILAAAYQNNRLRVLYRENGQIWREGARQVPYQVPSATQLYGICGNTSLFGLNTELTAADLYGGLSTALISTINNEPVFASNSRHTFIVHSGQVTTIQRFRRGAPLPSTHCLLWAGEDVGFALTRSANGIEGTLFNASQENPRRIGQPSEISLKGTVRQTACYFGNNYVWLLAQVVRADGTMRTHLRVMDNSGYVRHSATYPATDYFERVRGHAAGGSSLFVLTDHSVVELTVNNYGELVKLSQTQRPVRFTDKTSILVVGQPGEGYVVGNSTITPMSLPVSA